MNVVFRPYNLLCYTSNKVLLNVKSRSRGVDGRLEAEEVLLYDNGQ